jgi:hypothetical protein
MDMIYALGGGTAAGGMAALIGAVYLGCVSCGAVAEHMIYGRKPQEDDPARRPGTART